MAVIGLRRKLPKTRRYLRVVLHICLAEVWRSTSAFRKCSLNFGFIVLADSVALLVVTAAGAK